MPKRIIDIPEEVNIRLKTIAESQGKSVKSVIVRMLDEGSKKEYPDARKKLNRMAKGK